MKALPVHQRFLQGKMTLVSLSPPLWRGREMATQKGSPGTQEPKQLEASAAKPTAFQGLSKMANGSLFLSLVFSLWPSKKLQGEVAFSEENDTAIAKMFCSHHREQVRWRGQDIKM